MNRQGHIAMTPPYAPLSLHLDFLLLLIDPRAIFHSLLTVTMTVISTDLFCFSLMFPINPAHIPVQESTASIHDLF